MSTMEAFTTLRLDKWLWAARFYKTRSLATQMIDGGKVWLNNQRVKPAHAVRIGDLVRLKQGDLIREIRIQALSDQRRGAPEAILLYQEQQLPTATTTKTPTAWENLPSPGQRRGRPTKRERRQWARTFTT